MPKGIGLDMTEMLLGHSGYLTDEYRRYTDEEIQESYLKGMHLVSIFTTTSDKDIKRLDEQLKNKDTEIQELNKKLEAMDRDLRKLMIDRLTKKW